MHLLSWLSGSSRWWHGLLLLWEALIRLSLHLSRILAQLYLLLRVLIVLKGLLHLDHRLRLSLQLLVQGLWSLIVLHLGCHWLHLSVLRGCLLRWDCHLLLSCWHA